MILLGGFLVSPLVAVILSAYFFKNYFYEKNANKFRSPQNQVKTGGTLAAAISFAAAAVIITSLIIRFFITLNEAIKYM